SGIRAGLRGYLGKIRRYLGRKQPKTCVWVSAVGRERSFAKVSRYSGLNLNQYGKARQRCTGLNLIYYISA
ncbi:hypothetical protein, partial [Neisseria meningitidis]|uniref:hypothetical protein n=1 Tax=Neisseria meningitidis TaxID=487 RepID=UPI00311C8E88